MGDGCGLWTVEAVDGTYTLYNRISSNIKNCETCFNQLNLTSIITPKKLTEILRSIRTFAIVSSCSTYRILFSLNLMLIYCQPSS